MTIKYKNMETKVCKRCGREDPLSTWTSVAEQLPPLGVHVTVCRIEGNTQGIWGQIFKSREEIQASGITHWYYYKKLEQ